MAKGQWHRTATASPLVSYKTKRELQYFYYYDCLMNEGFIKKKKVLKWCFLSVKTARIYLYLKFVQTDASVNGHPNFCQNQSERIDTQTSIKKGKGQLCVHSVESGLTTNLYRQRKKKDIKCRTLILHITSWRLQMKLYLTLIK